MTNEEIRYHYMGPDSITTPCGETLPQAEWVASDWAHVTCSACLIEEATKHAPPGRDVPALLAEVRTVRETAARHAAYWTELMDDALRLENRLERALRAPESAENGPAGTPVTPCTFLADLRRFASQQRATSKPMPY